MQLNYTLETTDAIASLLNVLDFQLDISLNTAPRPRPVDSFFQHKVLHKQERDCTAALRDQTAYGCDAMHPVCHAAVHTDMSKKVKG